MEEELKPFQEKAELADGFIDEIKEKLGEEDSSKITESLLGLRSTIVEATDLHKTTVEEKIKYEKRNKELVEVNNDLFIKNSNAIKGKNDPKDNDLDIDDDDSLDTYLEEATKKSK